MTDSSGSIRRDGVDTAPGGCESRLMAGHEGGRWGDEIGCVDGDAHDCAGAGQHTRHVCRRCDAVVFDDDFPTEAEWVRLLVRAQYGRHTLVHAPDGGCRLCPLVAGDPIHHHPAWRDKR